MHAEFLSVLWMICHHLHFIASCPGGNARCRTASALSIVTLYHTVMIVDDEMINFFADECDNALPWWRRVVCSSVADRTLQLLSVAGATPTRVGLFSVTHVGNKRHKHGRFDAQRRSWHCRRVAEVMHCCCCRWMWDVKQVSKRNDYNVRDGRSNCVSGWKTEEMSF